MTDKPWGGRFDDDLDAVAARINASVDVDQRLGLEDVRGSIAHVDMLAHHLLAWVEMLERDRPRLDDARARMTESPLGAAALAGTTFPIDRAQTATELGFSRPMGNSLDAVADRDFLLESLAALS